MMAGLQLILGALLAFSIGLLVFHFVLYPALLWAVWRLMLRPTVSRPTGTATVSLVIATHNEAPIIVERLKNALAQTVGDFELILVSDGSNDGTAALARSLDDARLSVIELDERRGKAHALNTGAAAAKGDVIVVRYAEVWSCLQWCCRRGHESWPGVIVFWPEWGSSATFVRLFF